MTAVSIEKLLAQEVGSFAELIRAQAQAAPDRPAIVTESATIDRAALDALMDRVAAALQRDGVVPGDSIAVAATSSIEVAAVYLGAVRAGAAVAPLQPQVSPDSLAAMIEDTGARHLFVDTAAARRLDAAARPPAAARIALDGGSAGQPFADWLAPPGLAPRPVDVDPLGPFNIIYSSGTTGRPKGIVQPNRMRWAHLRRCAAFGYGADTLNLVSTPLYSNTTLVNFLPTIPLGGTIVLQTRFDAGGFLRLAEAYRATHATLVPVQYERVLRVPDFDRFDLSSFRLKFCTSAHLPATTKAEILARWPGGLVEVYGMTEGGGTCLLAAHEHPDKLHTVGRPARGHELHVIDDEGRVLAAGEVGEVVGRSPTAMMTGYHHAPAETAAALWHDAGGRPYIRTGDLARFDEDGFLTLVGRKKDVIISGGFNVYAVDLETVLATHPAVAEAAVVGVPSPTWGETPVAFIVLRAGHTAEPESIRAFANERLGNTQRIAAVELTAELPRSTIGKVLKRELRERAARATLPRG